MRANYTLPLIFNKRWTDKEGERPLISVQDISTGIAVQAPQPTQMQTPTPLTPSSQFLHDRHQSRITSLKQLRFNRKFSSDIRAFTLPDL